MEKLTEKKGRNSGPLGRDERKMPYYLSKVGKKSVNLITLYLFPIFELQTCKVVRAFPLLVLLLQ